MVNRQDDLVLSFFQRGLRQVDLVFFHQGVSDVFAQGLQECVGHAAADDHLVGFFQHVFNHADLVGYLGTANDGHEGVFRVIHGFAQHVHFLFHQESETVFREVGRNADSGCMCTVYGTECIFHKYVTQACPVLAQFRIVLGFAFFITGVLDQQDLTVLQVIDHFFQNGTAGLIAEFHLCVRQQFSQTDSHALQAVLRLVLFCLHLAQVGHQDDFGSLLQQVFDRRQGLHDPVVIRDDSVLAGHVEIAADDDLFAFDVQVFDSSLCHDNPPMLFAS